MWVILTNEIEECRSDPAIFTQVSSAQTSSPVGFRVRHNTYSLLLMRQLRDWRLIFRWRWVKLSSVHRLKQHNSGKRQWSHQNENVTRKARYINMLNHMVKDRSLSIFSQIGIFNTSFCQLTFSRGSISEDCVSLVMKRRLHAGVLCANAWVPVRVNGDVLHTLSVTRFQLSLRQTFKTKFHLLNHRYFMLLWMP